MACGPTVFGWSSDGASVNGIRLQARVAVAFAAVALHRKGEAIPVQMIAFVSAFAHVGVKHVAHANATIRVINMWKETAVAWKTNAKLNPLMQAKSLRSMGITTVSGIDDVCAKFDKHMSLVDASLKPQGHVKSRMRNMMSEDRFSQQHWLHLERYFGQPGLRYESCAYQDAHFDCPGFWVG